MNWFNINFKKIVFWFFAITLPLLSIQTEKRLVVDHYVDRPFFFVISAFQQGFFYFASSVQGTASQYLNLLGVKKDNESLREELATIKEKLLAFEEMSLENTRLRQALQFRERSKLKLQGAQVVAFDLLGDHSTVTIDKGSLAGIQPGMAVITLEGIVGRVYRAELGSSQVLLIADRFAVVDAIVARSRARGIVEGYDANSARFRYIEKAADLREGDMIVTSGLDQHFPKGLPVVTVTRIQDRSFNPSLLVELRPVVNLNRLEEVLIVMQTTDQDFEQLFSVPAEPKQEGASE